MRDTTENCIILDRVLLITVFFFLNARAPTEIYPLPLHDPLPICNNAKATPPMSNCGYAISRARAALGLVRSTARGAAATGTPTALAMSNGHARIQQTVYEVDDEDRKSTRLNSSHSQISYAVFCLK